MHPIVIVLGLFVACALALFGFVMTCEAIGGYFRRKYLRRLGDALIYTDNGYYPESDSWWAEWTFVQDAGPFARVQAWNLLEREGRIRKEDRR